MSSTTADPVGMETSANEQPTVNDQESSVPTTAAPSAEVVSAATATAPATTAIKKKNSNSKSKKKRQHAALQSMISQLKQLCNQVGQQTSFIDAGKLLNDMSNTSSPMSAVGEMETTTPSSPYPVCVERGMRIPPSVWKPQVTTHHPLGGGHGVAFRSGLPPPKEIRLTAAEREGLQKEEKQKEVRSKLRCAVTISELEVLLREAEAAKMNHEVELARRKIQKLTPSTQTA